MLGNKILFGKNLFLLYIIATILNDILAKIKYNVLLFIYSSTWKYVKEKTQRHNDRNLKKGVLKSIPVYHMIKRTSFQLYRAHPGGVIWKI